MYIIPAVTWWGRGATLRVMCVGLRSVVVVSLVSFYGFFFLLAFSHNHLSQDSLSLVPPSFFYINLIFY